MKRIVISCDGTWNRADSKHPTNALKIARAVEPEDGGGAAQIVRHIDGVGTGRGTGRIARAMDVALGGAMGLGLMRNMSDVYRFLVFNYSPGDEIYIFGFSRGAFTARSFVGLIRNCGVLLRSEIDHLPDALKLYRSRAREDHPDGDKARTFRVRHSVEDRTPIAFVGVWDTVGSLGIPSHLWWAAHANRGFAFHDTALSSTVAAARHAVSIDERRRTYSPALWSNLDARNAGKAAPPFRQYWFPGDHGGVGGGGESSLLSNYALHWVARGATAAGLSLSRDLLDEWAGSRDCAAPFPETQGWIKRLVAMGYVDRAGPDTLDDLAEAAVHRWRVLPSWRPGSLTRVAHLLDGGET